MAPVPAFDARGLMPPFLGSDAVTKDRSPYEVTMPEIVASLGTTQVRRGLIRGLLDYRGLLTQLGYTTGVQFIDGSFAENIEAREGREPDDIDVFSYLMRPAHYQDPTTWAASGFAEWSSEIVDRARNRLRFRLDTYAIAVDQHGPLRLIIETIYWYSLFAHKRITHDWKGFLRVRLSATDDAAARTLL
jgi:Family of unknown function (DUF6932)